MRRVAFHFTRLKVEYEYSLFNNDFEIAAIYNKENRKNKLKIDINNIKIIEPIHSEKLTRYQPVKNYNYTSYQRDANIYVLILNQNKSIYSVLIEPDPTTLNYIKKRIIP